MAQQSAAYHPQSYTIWYEHSAGINPRLSGVLEQRLAARTPLTDDDVWRLHANYVIARDVEAVEKMQQQLQALLQDATEATTIAGEEATQFTQTLVVHQSLLLQPASLQRVQDIVADLIAETERMRTTTKELAEQLERHANEVRSLTEQLEHAEHQALLDPLTGLLNRRGFEQRVQTLVSDAGGIRGGTLLIADIDRFKSINDNYGHVLGDKVIRTVAQVIGANIKGRDIASRIGGEEFAIFLPDTGIGGARALSEQICLAVAGRTIRRSDRDRPVERITVSIGIATAWDQDTLEGLIERADSAMYAAKRSGRNRAHIYDGVRREA